MGALSGNDALSGRRILIVEDVAENRRLFRAILNLEDAVVIEAGGALEGIEAVRASVARGEAPDLILMDMQMPEMDGVEATRRLRGDAQTQAIPIVLLTASAMDEDRDRAREAGCDGYITKPIDPPTFVSQIASFLQPDAPSST
jgi:CheY-like chemotaxis protein